MEQPHGFVIRKHPDHVYRLKRAIYGPKQASRAWNKTCDRYLRSLGCHNFNADTTLYIASIQGKGVFLLVYVDDILVIGKFHTVVQHITNLSRKRVDKRGEGEQTKFLGIGTEIFQSGGAIRMYSTRMINHMVQIFGLTNARPVSTPLLTGTVLYQCRWYGGCA